MEQVRSKTIRPPSFLLRVRLCSSRLIEFQAFMLWNYWCLFFECGIIRVVVRNVQIFVIRLTVFDSDSSLCTLQFFGRKIGTILFTSLSLFKHFVKQSYLRFFAKIFNTIPNLSKRTAGCLCSRCRLFVFFLMLTKFTQMSIYSRPFNC